MDGETEAALRSISGTIDVLHDGISVVAQESADLLGEVVLRLRDMDERLQAQERTMAELETRVRRIERRLRPRSV